MRLPPSWEVSRAEVYITMPPASTVSPEAARRAVTGGLWMSYLFPPGAKEALAQATERLVEQLEGFAAALSGHGES